MKRKQFTVMCHIYIVYHLSRVIIDIVIINSIFTWNKKKSDNAKYITF